MSKAKELGTMKAKDLIATLECYEDDAEVEFLVCHCKEDNDDEHDFYVEPFGVVSEHQGDFGRDIVFGLLNKNSKHYEELL